MTADRFLLAGCVLVFLCLASSSVAEADRTIRHGAEGRETTGKMPVPHRVLSGSLGELVEAFFRSDDPKERRQLGKAIEEAAGGSVETVAGEVRRAKLWSKPDLREATLAVDLSPVGEDHRLTPLARARRDSRASGERSRTSASDSPTSAVSVTYRLPADYNPAHGYPTILCMPGEGNAGGEALLLAVEVLGEPIRECILIRPHHRVGGAFHQPVHSASDFRLLMRQMRRLFHIDTDRVFLFGLGTGGEAAWMTAIAHAELFAGVITLSACPRVPYSEQAYPFLLKNLQRLPVLTVWSQADDTNAAPERTAVAAHNRAIVKFARQAGLPIVGVEVPHRDGLADLTPPADEVARLLGRRREPVAREVAHWFRYPGQGRTGWLRQTRYMGEVWEADQLAILPSPATDRDTFIADVVKAKLAHVGGRIDGQTITIQTRACARVDVLLPEDAVDWSRPVFVYCNGKKRRERPIVPSIQTLLETAYEDWEFQRLATARLSFSIRTDAR